MPADPLIILGLVIPAVGGCSAAAGCVAYVKRRSPLEGIFLGLLLGPIGLLIECRHPYTQRPVVDAKAWNSLRSVMSYQQAGRESRRGRGDRPGKATG